MAKKKKDFVAEFEELYTEKFKELGKQKQVLEKQKKEHLEKARILKKYSKGVHNEKEFRELCSVLCFKSLSWCCGIEGNPFGGSRHCFWRDNVLKDLGISKKEFAELKTGFDKKIMENVNQKE